MRDDTAAECDGMSHLVKGSLAKGRGVPWSPHQQGCVPLAQATRDKAALGELVLGDVLASIANDHINDASLLNRLW